MKELQFFNPYGNIGHTENRLPHWQQKGTVCFITFRLADALPKSLLDGWEDEKAIWLRLHPEPWSAETEGKYHERFSGAIERWLDAGHGACVLRTGNCGKLVAETLRHFDGDRLVLISSVVMPNHVHALFIQHPKYSVENVLRSWKTFTARRINSLLERKGGLWQRDYFDRLVRDEKHFANCIRDVRNNPSKAGLAGDGYILYESELARQVE
ncbi:MAG: type site-specific deoxyribonuclease, HsdR family [Spartobacteria bacterium]|nr:type site-specific deoxyribonuclease, HsdR family [Spartobacteria bacterium]